MERSLRADGVSPDGSPSRIGQAGSSGGLRGPVPQGLVLGTQLPGWAVRKTQDPAEGYEIRRRTKGRRMPCAGGGPVAAAMVRTATLDGRGAATGKAALEEAGPRRTGGEAKGNIFAGGGGGVPTIRHAGRGIRAGESIVVKTLPAGPCSRTHPDILVPNRIKRPRRPAPRPWTRAGCAGARHCGAAGCPRMDSRRRS